MQFSLDCKHKLSTLIFMQVYIEILCNQKKTSFPKLPPMLLLVFPKKLRRAFCRRRLENEREPQLMTWNGKSYLESIDGREIQSH